MKDFNLEKIESFINLITNEVHVRYELGEPYKNGSDKRINQVIQRSTTLFESIFIPGDELLVYVKDWEVEDIMFGNTTPSYLYELFTGQEIVSMDSYDEEDDVDEEGNKIIIKNTFKLSLIETSIEQIQYKKILTGIAHYEQGREPSIGQTVYFINFNKGILFHMYDDRGCIIYSDKVESLRNIYETYNDWIVDYHREYIDGFFRI